MILYCHHCHQKHPHGYPCYHPHHVTPNTITAPDMVPKPDPNTNIPWTLLRILLAYYITRPTHPPPSHILLLILGLCLQIHWVGYSIDPWIPVSTLNYGTIITWANLCLIGRSHLTLIRRGGGGGWRFRQWQKIFLLKLTTLSHRAYVWWKHKGNNIKINYHYDPYQIILACNKIQKLPITLI